MRHGIDVKYHILIYRALNTTHETTTHTVSCYIYIYGWFVGIDAYNV